MNEQILKRAQERYQPPELPIRQLEDFSQILKAGGSHWQASFPYLLTDSPAGVQGWILHVSAIPSGVRPLLDRLVPELIAMQVPFKIPMHSALAESLLSGELGYQQFGKIITIYPTSDQQAREIAEKLIFLTQDLRGPAIPTDIHLGGTVYARYGSFNPESDGANVTIRPTIFDPQGNQIPDNCTIPCSLPGWVSWPFAGQRPLKKKTSKVFHKHYIIISELKNDIKGAALLAVNKKYWWRFQIDHCVIKQARKDVNTDQYGRDITDRLAWQYTLLQQLAPIAAVPQAFELFFEDGNAYLVQQYIEGSKLAGKILAIYNDQSWINLDASARNELLGYLLQVIGLVETLHGQGIVHRDLNPDNFIVDKNGKLWTIDLELAYDVKLSKPSPPFVQGTPGFMSPEQQAVLTPTFDQDIYALGAVMFLFFAGISLHFGQEPTDQLDNRIFFFTRNRQISSLIARCLSPVSYERPVLQEISAVITELKQMISSEHPVKPSLPAGTENVQAVIERAIAGLKDQAMLGDGKIWLSKVISQQQGVLNEVRQYAHYMGVQQGVAGVLLALSDIKMAGYNVEGLRKEIAANWKFLEDYYLRNITELPLGLMSGSAGLALMIAKGLDSGLIAGNHGTVHQLKYCFNKPAADLSLSTGIAGQGLAALACRRHLEKDVFKELMGFTVGSILANQTPDGSWLFPVPYEPGSLKPLYNLAYGTSGVVYFLLAYYQHSKEQKVRDAIVKATSWLKAKVAITTPGPGTRNAGHAFDPWLLYGNAGVVVTLLKAMEVLQVDEYRQVITQALAIYPENIVTRSFAVDNGLAGLGHLYLEAFRVLADTRWHDRASWIAGLLQSSYHPLKNGSITWLVDYGSLPAADYLSASTGVLHYLARFNSPEKIPFPLNI